MDIQNETRLPMPELQRREGVATATIFRWRVNGVAGVRLEHFWIAGKCYTTEEAWERFNQRVNAAKNLQPA